MPYLDYFGLFRLPYPTGKCAFIALGTILVVFGNAFAPNGDDSDPVWRRSGHDRLLQWV